MKFLVGVGVGLAVGVAATSYLLSENGAELRSTMLKRYKQAYDEMQSRIQDAIQQGKEVYNRTKQELLEGYEQAQAE